jgi:hypothetical protein
MQGRLNTMQKSMLQWNEMHPYTAVHVVRLRGPLEAARLRDSLNRTVAKHGLARLSLDCTRSAYQYTVGPADCEVSTIRGDDGSLSALHAEIERQLNLPFDHRQPFSPFRFLVAPATDSFFLGVAYFHPAADAESMVWLLRDIVTCYRERGAPGSANRFELYPDNRAHRLWRRPCLVARKLLNLPAQVSNLRHSHRVTCRDAANMANGFLGFSLVPEDLRSLVAAAKSWSVTVNDLLMALLMKALAPGAEARQQSRQRRKLSLGCIVNLRQDLGLDAQRVFGVFLGSFIVTHEVPAGIPLRKLAADVACQTVPIKRHRLYLASPMELGFARFMLGFFSPGRRKKFYAKYYPLWGGITNLNLNRLWAPSDRHVPLDYFRAVSTGPVTPLALSVTTIGQRMNLGVSYRTTVFSKPDIEFLQSRFREILEETHRNP